jgi:hypothetical protein
MAKKTQRIGNLRNNLNPLKPPAGFNYGSTAGYGLGTGYLMPIAEQFGAPPAKDLSMPPQNVSPQNMKGHIKPPAKSVKPKSQKK